MNRNENAADSLAPSGFDLKRAVTSSIEILVLGGVVPTALLWFVKAQALPLVLPALVLFPLLLGLQHGFSAGTGSALLTVWPWPWWAI